MDSWEILVCDHIYRPLIERLHDLICVCGLAFRFRVVVNMHAGMALRVIKFASHSILVLPDVLVVSNSHLDFKIY